MHALWRHFCVYAVAEPGLLQHIDPRCHTIAPFLFASMPTVMRTLLGNRVAARLNSYRPGSVAVPLGGIYLQGITSSIDAPLPVYVSCIMADQFSVDVVDDTSPLDDVTPVETQHEILSPSTAPGDFTTSGGDVAFTEHEAQVITDSLLHWFDRNRRLLPWRGDAIVRADASLPATAASAASASAQSSPTVGHVAASSGARGSIEAVGQDGVVAGGVIPPPSYRNAYGTWVSEIMLQQTRVEAVVPYWLRWMDQFPTVSALADASSDEVNAAWAGLGFYRRAANLHKGAKEVVDKHGGTLPTTIEGLKSIPGIGDYTAGAIASISYGQQAALVDGNVVRVLSRLRAIRVDAKSMQLNKTCWRLARQLIPATTRPGDFNQALMELGATVCSPKSPSCGSCPLASVGVCRGYQAAAAACVDVEDAATSPSPRVSPAAGAESKSKGKVQAKLSFGAVLTHPSSSASSSSSSPSASAGTTAASSSTASSTSAAIARHIAFHFPLPPTKKAVPTHRVAAAVIEVRLDDAGAVGGSSRYLFLRYPNSGVANGAGALLAGQWQPVAMMVSDQGYDVEVDDEVVAGDDAPKEATGVAGKRKRDQQAATSSSSAAGDAAGLAVTRGRILASIQQQQQQQAGTASLAMTAVPCPPVTHAFSHVVHEIQVERWVVNVAGAGGAVESVCACIAGAVTASPASSSVSLASPASASRPEVRWSTVAGLEADLGLTTWTAKILHSALQDDARTALGEGGADVKSGRKGKQQQRGPTKQAIARTASSTSASGATSRSQATASAVASTDVIVDVETDDGDPSSLSPAVTPCPSSSAVLAAWRSLRDRWAKAGCAV